MNKSKLLKIYKNFLKIRLCQEKIVEKYHPEDKMKCPMHLCIGQELTPSILGYYLNKNDSIFSHHRSHGYFLANNGSMKEMIAEFYGKETGTNGGLAGSQELSCTKTNFYSGTILSGAFAMAVGDAYAKISNKSNNISIAVIGDGGMEEGITFEAINLAHLMKLPVLFICENNKYSTHTNIKERTKTFFVSDKIRGFGIKTILVKKQSLNKIDLQIENIIKNMRKDKKPVFIEILTYRFNGHVGPEGDDHFNYRPKKEINYWKNNDPLPKIEKKINSQKIVNKYRNEITKEINSSFDFAEKSRLAKKWKQYNFNNSYSKVVKSFYKKKLFFSSSQEEHKPNSAKPY